MKSMFLPLPTYRRARAYAPWAAVISRVEGGFLAFASVTDYRVWKGTL